MRAEIFLQDLAVVMMVAAVVTVLFRRLRQPVVLGYIVAGVIIGPHTPPFPLVRDEEAIHTLAELGVMLLMFSLGLELSLRKLKRIGPTAFVAAFLEIALMIWVGYELGGLFGWGMMDSLFLGAMLSISSTTIIAKALGELGKTKEPFAQLIFGILIWEDILAIGMIALLSGISMTGRLSVADLGITLGKLAVFLVAALVVGLLTAPGLLGYVGRFKSSEMLLITTLGLCFGFSLLAVKLGYSVALGAFLIGAVIAEAREIHRIESLIEPIRDMFSAIFFVAIGLLIEPKLLVAYWLPIVVITAAVVMGKVVTCSLGAFVGGKDRRTAVRVGMGLAQIGEFSFIIASLGVSLKVTSGFLYPIAVAVSVLTTSLTPYLMRGTDRAVNWFDRMAPTPLLNWLELYTRWIAQVGGGRHPSLAAKLVRRWTWQMALNLALIGAIFVAAVFVGRNPPGWLKGVGLGAGARNAALWLAAVVVSLPMFIATFRKLQALGLLVAELKITDATFGVRAGTVRTMVAHTIPISGAAAMAFYALALSSTLLPSVSALAILAIPVALLNWVLWRSCVKVYAKAQVALQEVLTQPSPSRPAASLPSLLREADLETVVIARSSPAAGKMIAELSLRTQTGASIVGIERAGANLINPGPDEELHAEDRVVLLGGHSQLKAARRLLLGAGGEETRTETEASETG